MRNGALIRVPETTPAGFLKLNDRAWFEVDAGFWRRRLPVERQQPQTSRISATKAPRGNARSGTEEVRVDDAARVVSQLRASSAPLRPHLAGPMPLSSPVGLARTQARFALACADSRNGSGSSWTRRPMRVTPCAFHRRHPRCWFTCCRRTKMSSLRNTRSVYWARAMGERALQRR